METENQEKQNNDTSHALDATLADLPVTDEHAEHAKGGGDDMPTEAISFSFGQVKSRPPSQ